MLLKIAGIFLLVVGVALAVGMLAGIAAGLVGLLWLMVKAAVVCGLTFWGWRWLHHRSGWAKVAGAFLMVAGTVLSLPLLGELLVGALGLMGSLIKGALVGGLLYLGWRWFGGRRAAGTATRGY